MERALDPLSDVFASLSVRTGSLSGIDAAGRWALRLGVHEHIKIGAVLAGSCRIGVDGGPRVELTAGDCFLLAARDSFVVSGDQDAPAQDGEAVFHASPTRIVRVGDGTGPADGPRTLLIGGSVQFLDATVALLLSGLPSLTAIRADSAPARAIQPLLRLCLEEVEAARLGMPVMIGRLTELLFIQAMRALVEGGQDAGTEPHGWLGALGDQRIGAALLLMHGEPARRWTVAALGDAVGMSRAGFAARFKQLVGLPPLEYLQRWRISTAGSELLGGDRTVASVAAAWGYSSEAAFSAAFKRITGVSPGRYRADPLRAAPPLPDGQAIAPVFHPRPPAPGQAPSPEPAPR
ncbi:AraC family transcriptional regulator [Streptomyces sp. NBC_01190]|uniref:AraC family transcriptional regulator n=1 Tax=Streptomyces sp. NBC_01190 TaxID=2903767 RepID=UPI00386B2344|nr:AraC family transcriptional regulator [Streptomyces sp. NBC_01190]